MADSQSPIICITCQRSFPDDLKVEDAPRYFVQESLLPRSDEDISFTNEALVILSYIETVSHVTRHAAELEEEHYNDILDRLFQLSEEAKRRLRLADAARREIWKRDHGHEEYVKALQEGRA
jgi:hypothetical protein